MDLSKLQQLVCNNWKALHEKSSEKLPDNVFLAPYLAGRGTVEESERSPLVLN